MFSEPYHIAWQLVLYTEQFYSTASLQGVSHLEHSIGDIGTLSTFLVTYFSLIHASILSLQSAQVDQLILIQGALGFIFFTMGMCAELISSSTLTRSTWDFYHWIPSEKLLKMDYLLGLLSRLVSELIFNGDHTYVGPTIASLCGT